jgi:hypothetical protein
MVLPVNNTVIMNFDLFSFSCCFFFSSLTCIHTLLKIFCKNNSASVENTYKMPEQINSIRYGNRRLLILLYIFHAGTIKSKANVSVLLLCLKEEEEKYNVKKMMKCQNAMSRICRPYVTIFLCSFFMIVFL